MLAKMKIRIHPISDTTIATITCMASIGLFVVGVFACIYFFPGL
jgi:hypothetical protein